MPALEFYLRSFIGAWLSLEVCLLSEPEHACKNRGWERPNFHVVILNHFIEPPSLDGYPVFGAFKLGLQLKKIFIGFQRGIILRDRKQPGESGSSCRPVLPEISETSAGC